MGDSERDAMKEMRAKTSLPLMICKKWLEQANWNVREAIMLAYRDYRDNSPYIMRDYR